MEQYTEDEATQLRHAKMGCLAMVALIIWVAGMVTVFIPSPTVALVGRILLAIATVLIGVFLFLRRRERRIYGAPLSAPLAHAAGAFPGGHDEPGNR